jgi:hypothetical protein
MSRGQRGRSPAVVNLSFLERHEISVYTKVWRTGRFYVLCLVGFVQTEVSEECGACIFSQNQQARKVSSNDSLIPTKQTNSVAFNQQRNIRLSDRHLFA